MAKVDFDNIPSASHAADAPDNTSKTTETAKSEPHKEKVVKGKVTVEKKNGLQKLAKSFLPNDLSKVGHTIVYDMLIPAGRDFLVNSLMNAINMVFYSNGVGPANRPYNTFFNSSNVARPGTNSLASFYSWNTPSYAANQVPADYNQQVNPSRDYRSLHFTSRRDAEGVLTAMFETLATYGKVTVADYYDFAGISTEWTDNKYGWYDLRGSDIKAINGGFIIILPKAVVIK